MPISCEVIDVILEPNLRFPQLPEQAEYQEEVSRVKEDLRAFLAKLRQDYFVHREMLDYHRSIRKRKSYRARFSSLVLAPLTLISPISAPQAEVTVKTLVQKPAVQAPARRLNIMALSAPAAHVPLIICDIPMPALVFTISAPRVRFDPMRTLPYYSNPRLREFAFP